MTEADPQIETPVWERIAAGLQELAHAVEVIEGGRQCVLCHGRGNTR